MVFPKKIISSQVVWFSTAQVIGYVLVAFKISMTAAIVTLLTIIIAFPLSISETIVIMCFSAIMWLPDMSIVIEACFLKRSLSSLMEVSLIVLMAYFVDQKLYCLKSFDHYFLHLVYQKLKTPYRY